MATAVVVPPALAIIRLRLLRAAAEERAAGTPEWREYCLICKWLGYIRWRLRRERNR